MLEVQNVTKIFGKGENEFTAINNVSITLRKGETIAIVGKSGSGKSTLLHILIGLDTPTNGFVRYKNKDINAMDTDYWRGNHVGIVFQQFFLQNNETVLQNVTLPLKIRGIKRNARTARARKALQLVGLTHKESSRAVDLSGGEKQRVAIARAIIDNPDILVTDEPTGNLDTANSKIVENILFDLNKKIGSTLIIVTHHLEFAKKCKRVIQLQDGHIVADTATNNSRIRP